MGKKSKKYQNEEIVDCKSCDGIISIGFHMGHGDLLCCEECGSEYLINSRKPLRLELIKDEDDEGDDDTYDLMGGYTDDDDDYSVAGYGYGDDDYNDGRDY